MEIIYSLAFVLLILLGLSLLVWQMNFSLKYWNEQERILAVTQQAANFCRNRPVRKTKKKLQDRVTANERRLEKLRAKNGYYGS